MSVVVHRTKSVSSGNKSYGHMSHPSLSCQQADEYTARQTPKGLQDQMLVFHSKEQFASKVVVLSNLIHIFLDSV